MIPEKEDKIKKNTEEDKSIGFTPFDIEHFIRRLIKNWYWFVVMFLLSYGIGFIYDRYYAQRIYASELSLSISSNAASYLTPNQSINFIWGQSSNQNGVFLKKMLLSSLSLNHL